MINLRTALEDALAENPDDLASHAAYADLLAEQGDPRGEFIQVQLTLEDQACKGERRKDLKNRQLMLLAHEREWLAELAIPFAKADEQAQREGRRTTYFWRRGWLDDVRIWDLSEELARVLARAPAARLISSLGIDDGDLQPLRDASFLRHLRYFRFGEAANFEASRFGRVPLAYDLPALIALMPRLEELELFARGLGLPELFQLPTLTRLRTLVIYHERNDVYPLDLLAENPAFSALERLRLHSGPGGDYDSCLPLEEVTALFYSPHLGNLRHLHLHGSSMGDDGIEELVESGLIERLETLDLRFGSVTDAGVNLLLDSPHVRNLEFLSLANNELSEEGVSLLQDLELPVVHCEDQGEDYYYEDDME